MLQAWRIVKERYVATAFDGDGARRYGGRWNTPGVPAVYASETRALAILEVLAGLGSAAPLPAYVIARAEFDPGLVEAIDPPDLPADWNRYPPGAASQRIGDRWLAEARSAVLAVPSAIVPQERNFLLNHLHPDFGRVRIGPPEPFAFDPRLG